MRAAVVQQPVAQRFRFGSGQVAIEGEQLGPGEKIGGYRHERPDGRARRFDEPILMEFDGDLDHRPRKSLVGPEINSALTAQISAPSQGTAHAGENPGTT